MNQGKRSIVLWLFEYPPDETHIFLVDNNFQFIRALGIAKSITNGNNPSISNYIIFFYYILCSSIIFLKNLTYKNCYWICCNLQELWNIHMPPQATRKLVVLLHTTPTSKYYLIKLLYLLDNLDIYCLYMCLLFDTYQINVKIGEFKINSS